MTVFETALLSKTDNLYRGFTPAAVDRAFWSDTLNSAPYANQPDVPFYLVTETGDRLIESVGNPFLALT